MRPSTPHGRFFPGPLARHWTALLLAVVLVLGSAVHFGHHLLEPGCDEGTGPGSHPCVLCVSMHGAALASDAIAAAQPIRLETSGVVIDVLAAPRPVARISGDPRAPPRG
jgi:hypothetical protein